MENSPRNQSEEEKALAAKAEALDDDDEDEEKTEKKKSTPHAALGVELEEIRSDANKEKPRLSITDRLLESIGAKSEEEVEVSDSKEQTESEKEKVAGQTQETIMPLRADEAHDLKDGDVVEVTSESASDTLASYRYESTTLVPEETIEAANWEDEPSTKEPAELHSSSEEAGELAEDHEAFAEISHSSEDAVEEEADYMEPELLEDGLGGEGLPEPPEDEPPQHSGSGAGSGSSGSFGGGGGSAERPWYDSAAADRARQAELNEAEYRGQKIGLRHGLAAGLTFGWLFGRRGKKKQAKEHINELKTKDREIKSLKNEQYSTAAHLKAVKRTQEQLSSHIRQQELKPATSPENMSQRQSKLENVSKNITKTLEKYPTPAMIEVATVSAALTAVERSSKTITKAETAKKHENSQKIENAPENQEVTDETYHVADGRRVETSAWHRIEIDEKTGKAVENPEIAYGEEFKHERRQEILRVSADDDTKEDFTAAKKPTKATHQQEAAAHVARIGGLAAASYVHEDQTYANTKQRETGLAALPAHANTKEVKMTDSLMHYASMPIIWVVAVVIVVIMFILGALN